MPKIQALRPILLVNDPALSGALYLNVDDVDALYAEAKAAGAAFEQEPTDKPCGMREFTLQDPNGYTLIFGSPLAIRAVVRGT